MNRLVDVSIQDDGIYTGPGRGSCYLVRPAAPTRLTNGEPTDVESKVLGLSLLAFFILTNLLPSLHSLQPPPRSPRSLLLQQLLQILRHVEHPPRARPTRGTRRVLPIPLQRAALAEVMAALRHDRIPILLPANDARERNPRQDLILVARVLFLRVPVRARDLGTGNDLLALGDVLPLLVELPAGFVILSGVQVFAVVAEAAEARLLVVLADVGREIGHGDGADVGRRLHGPHDSVRRIGVLLDEGRRVRETFVRPLGRRGPCAPEQVPAGEGVGGILVVPVRLLGGVVGALDGGAAVGGELGRRVVGCARRGVLGGDGDGAGVLPPTLDLAPGVVFGGRVRPGVAV